MATYRLGSSGEEVSRIQERLRAPGLYRAPLDGDFGGQGISFGVLQWNFGQNTLQPLLNDMLALHPAVIAEIFHENLPALTAAPKPPIRAGSRTCAHASCASPGAWRGSRAKRRFGGTIRHRAGSLV